MYSRVAINPNPLLRNDAYDIVMKGVQQCTCKGALLRGRYSAPLYCIKLDTVTDFTCGTGGFLVDALHHVEDLPKLQHSFYGVEKSHLPYMLCTTNMMLNDIAEPDIMHDNSLEQDVKRYTDDDKFDIILMNLPYGGSELEIVQKNFPAELRETLNNYSVFC